MRAAGRISLMFVVLLVVVAPRFNQNDLGPVDAISGTEVGGNRGDAARYTQYVDALRGDVDDLPPAPFRYRPLAPVLAAPLPFDAMTSLNIVNVVALMASVLALWWMLTLLGVGERLRTAGCLLFIVSFPTFYYGSIGYVDPVALVFVMLGTAAVLADRPLVLLAIAPFAALARETTVIVLVVGLVWLVAHRRRAREVVLWSALWFGVFVVTTAVVRLTLRTGGTNVWRPSIDHAADSLSRPRTWISAILTLGVPAAIVLVKSRSRSSLRRQVVVVLGAGMLLSFGVWIYAVMAAYPDGRFLWPIYAFTVPAAMLLLAVPSTPTLGVDAAERGAGESA